MQWVVERITLLSNLFFHAPIKIMNEINRDVIYMPVINKHAMYVSMYSMNIDE